MTREELAEETERLQERMENIKKELEGMTANYAVENKRRKSR